MKKVIATVLDNRFLTLLFLVLAILGVFRHELWLDEAHHWLLARDSTSLKDLVLNTQYEGHPILWNVLLFFITRFTLDPHWMQLLSVFIGTITVFVFLKKAPFDKVFKVLFIFGYFMLYEYTMLSRNYMLGVLFLFLACSLYENRKHKFIHITIFLILSANVHALFLMIASVFFFMLILESILENGIKQSKVIWFGILLFGIGSFLASIQILPPSDTSFFDRLNEVTLTKRFGSAFVAFYKGLWPLPDFRNLHFWNTNLIINLNKSVASILAIIALILPMFIFYKNRLVLIFVYLGILGGNIFFFITQLGGLRYNGTLFILFIIALWIHAYHVSQQKTKDGTARNTLLRRNIILVLLGIHFISGVVAFSIDFIKPFTNAKNVVAFLETSRLNNRVIATKACDGTAISSYLEKTVFFTSSKQYQSYCRWGNPEVNVLSSKKQTIQVLVELGNKHKEGVIFISFQPIFGDHLSLEWTPLSKSTSYRLLKKFEESILNKGNYYVYEISKL